MDHNRPLADELVIENNFGHNPFHLASKYGIRNNMKLLTKIYPNYNQLIIDVDKSANSPLHLAVLSGSDEVVKFLITLKNVKADSLER